MKRKASLWGSVSVLISVIVGISALVRNALFVPMILLAFATWGVWVVLVLCVPRWHAGRIKRQQAKATKSVQEELKAADMSDLNVAQTLLRHVNYRITAYLQSSQPALRQYAFSTIAWRAMRQSIAAFHRSEERRKAAERAFAESQPVATDAWDALEGSLILHDLAVISSREQYALTQLRLQGYSIREAALAQGISPKRVRKLLKELYRVYLALTSPVVDTTEQEGSF